MIIYTSSNTIAFLYKWVEKSTNKWYIGARTAKGCHPADGYICSSRVVKPLILNCPTNWVRTIIIIGDPAYIVGLEAAYLALLNAKSDPMSYNQHNGDGKFNTTGIPSWNKGLKLESYILKNGEPFVPSAKGKPSRLKGKKVGSYSSERRENISKSLKGNIPWNVGITTGPLSEAHRLKISKSTKGIPKSEEHKQNQRKPKHSGHGALVSAARRGVPLPKIVCRLIDKREMDIRNYKKWIKNNPL